MSGVLRRGSLNFDCVGGPRDKGRGSLEANLYGGYRETRPGPKTPEISVIALDFRRYSEDLKKPPSAEQTEQPPSRDLSQDEDSDVISNFLGHYTRWSFLWTLLLCLFQLPTTFHLFMFVFQVSFGFMAWQIFAQLIASPEKHRNQIFLYAKTTRPPNPSQTSPDV